MSIFVQDRIRCQWQPKILLWEGVSDGIQGRTGLISLMASARSAKKSAGCLATVGDFKTVGSAHNRFALAVSLDAKSGLFKKLLSLPSAMRHERRAHETPKRLRGRDWVRIALRRLRRRACL